MFKKILYPVDLAHVEFAAGFASEVERVAETFGAEIEVMTVMPGFGMAIVASYFPPDAEQRARREVERQLGEFASSAFSRPVKIRVEQGTHWKRILSVAKEDAVDLVIMPHCDKGWAESVLVGSCAQKVAERAPCSVLLLRPGEQGPCLA
ncbi:universal stress protein [endosymbiont of unidentified scaly snail isolate Monju]|uniref:universal stress protein n=1 Tax=endosymbiont of unidentified scaly snail isolate Monju TaxID=1248727 RepID=UPI000389222D|nr:universal stress protein [endosymbiont of unidentified scaly snail isolate Monju]BAN68927.1 universal stress protein A [endosymbiont of unidentified scaly snail isolate Monju]